MDGDISSPEMGNRGCGKLSTFPCRIGNFILSAVLECEFGAAV